MKLLIMLALLGATQDDKKVKVVTTLQALCHVAQKVGGDRVVATVLVHPRRDPHRATADPQMQKEAGRADLFIELGRSLEVWAKDVVQNSGNTRIQTGAGRLFAGKGCSVEEVPQVLSKEWGDIHPEGNPHVWLDPLNIKTIAKNVAEALSSVDPEGKGTYEANLKSFDREIDEAMFGKDLVESEGGDLLWRKERLGKLDAYLKDEGLEAKLGGWTMKSRAMRGTKVVSYHKTFVYLARRFGFEIASELEEKPGIAPPAKHLEHVLELIQREKVRVILNEVYYPTGAADYVAGSTGAKVVVAPVDVGGIDGVDSYIGTIDYILDQMAAAMK